MGHCISALVVSGFQDSASVSSVDLCPIRLKCDLTMFPLHYAYCDHWAEKLDIPGFVADTPILNMRVVHHLATKIADATIFAIIETDYLGGHGEQAAAVYRGDEVVLTPRRAAMGPINDALRLLGVPHPPQGDRFELVGLQDHRDFDDVFKNLRYVYQD